MTKIAVLGGGNMGMLLAVKFSQNNSVSLYINSRNKKPEDYSKNMTAYNDEENSTIEGKLDLITNSLNDAIKDAEWIFITFPAFMFEDFSKELIPLLKEGQHLVFIPGSGGAELYFKDALKKGCTISGLQRVHSVARIIEQGKSVKESGVRKALHVASIPNSFNKIACEKIEKLYNVKVCALNNYLNITFINSNPILHTSRLYSIFKDFESIKEYDSLPLFYEEWDLPSSELIVKVDKELFNMIDVLKNNGITVDGITSLLVHYESTNAKEMTAKINSIHSLKGLKTPSVCNGNGKLLPDFSSRYFTADFDFGLDILLAFAKLLNVKCDNMNKISSWYHNATKTERKFDLNKFCFNNIQNIFDFYN